MAQPLALLAGAHVDGELPAPGWEDNAVTLASRTKGHDGRPEFIQCLCWASGRDRHRSAGLSFWCRVEQQRARLADLVGSGRKANNSGEKTPAGARPTSSGLPQAGNAISSAMRVSKRPHDSCALLT